MQRDVLLPLGIKRLNVLELVPRLCVEAIGHAWMGADHVYRIGAAGFLAEEMARLQGNEGMVRAARRVIEDMHRLERQMGAGKDAQHGTESEEEGAIDAEDGDTMHDEVEAVRERVSRLLDWVIHQNNALMARAGRRVLLAHDKALS